MVAGVWCRTDVLIGAMSEDSRFPCLDGHLYSGCIGRQICPVDRCLNGRRVRPCDGSIRADRFDQPLKVRRYVSTECANCLHAVDLAVENPLRTPGPGGRRVERWTICELSLWAGPCTLYNLLNHRAPVKRFEDILVACAQTESLGLSLG